MGGQGESVRVLLVSGAKLDHICDLHLSFVADFGHQHHLADCATNQKKDSKSESQKWNGRGQRRTVDDLTSAFTRNRLPLERERNCGANHEKGDAEPEIQAGSVVVFTRAHSQPTTRSANSETPGMLNWRTPTKQHALTLFLRKSLSEVPNDRPQLSGIDLPGSLPEN
jgi:hypothetical protein